MPPKSLPRPGPTEPAPIGKLINFKPFVWMKEALEARGEVMHAELARQAKAAGLGEVPPVTLSAVLRTCLTRDLRGQTPNATWLAGWAEGFLAGLTAQRKASGEAYRQLFQTTKDGEAHQ